MDNRVIETDLLCVGGGIAGLMAAIRAADRGAAVVVADKAKTSRSGSAGMGNDHFRCYIPEVHGPDIKPHVEALLRSPRGSMRTRAFCRTWLERSFEIVKLWESWGIPMKYQGRYEFAGHGLPGRAITGLKYSGLEQKPILTRRALDRGAKILDRTVIFDLLPEDGTFSAVGMDCRDGRMIGIRAKKVFLGTGLCTRLYPGPTPAWMFNMANSPNNTGDGRAMAYRAGAELANIELTMRWAGPKSFARCGKGSWVGVLRDPDGKPVGPFVTKPDRRYGDSAADVWETLFDDYQKQGKGPVSMDCSGISDDDFDYMMHWMKHEGNVPLLDHLTEEGIDIRKDPVEFMTYEMMFSGGILYKETGETSLLGLYAAGDEFFGAISCAAVFGWIAGEHASQAAEAGPLPPGSRLAEHMKEKASLFTAIRNRENGAGWQEVNVALQQIMADYAGSPRSETLLTAGLSHLRRLKQKAPSLLMARNAHELMHCIEVLNLLDLGELLLIAAAERRETRDRHVRSDYPFTNPLLDKWLVVRNTGGSPATEWREIKR
jgi:succinate dehydrogenase/fumarate reductase flavoprotein subunit